jgi:hypothetical protein
MFGMVAHGLITGMLFFIAGSVKERYHTLEISKLGGMLTAMPHLGWIFGFCSMASLGLPGLAGFWGEFPAILSAYNPAEGLNHHDVRIVDALADTLSGGEIIEARDIEQFVAGNMNSLQAAVSERPLKQMHVHNAITLTEGRLLQLERENFMRCFRTKESRKRISHMINTGRPLRENRPENAPSPSEIREKFKKVALNRRIPDGRPLTGADEKSLKGSAAIARGTIRILKFMGLY